MIPLGGLITKTENDLEIEIKKLVPEYFSADSRTVGMHVHLATSREIKKKLLKIRVKGTVKAEIQQLTLIKTQRAQVVNNLLQDLIISTILLCRYLYSLDSPYLYCSDVLMLLVAFNYCKSPRVTSSRDGWMAYKLTE